MRPYLYVANYSLAVSYDERVGSTSFIPIGTKPIIGALIIDHHWLHLPHRQGWGVMVVQFC
ncbi:MAG: hypothetical protein PVTTEEND_001746 [Candidatus Fervidibacter sp.]